MRESTISEYPDTSLANLIEWKLGSEGVLLLIDDLRRNIGQRKRRKTICRQHKADDPVIVDAVLTIRKRFPYLSARQIAWDCEHDVSPGTVEKILRIHLN